MLKKTLLITIITIFCLFIFIIFFPYFYNYYIHPLSGLAEKIQHGDSYDEVMEKLETYKDVSKDSTYGYARTVCSRYEVKKFKVKECWEAGQESIFDNPRIFISFDKNKKVVVKIYVGD